MVLTNAYKDGSTPKVCIIGAGLSGLCAAIQLQRQLQICDYTLFEMASDIGGTWLANTYPGSGCDTLSNVYNYSFAPNPDWSRKFAKQAEVLDYLRRTARSYNVYKNIQFNTKVTKMYWDQDRSKWLISWQRQQHQPMRQSSGNDDSHYDNSSSTSSRRVVLGQGVMEADIIFYGTGLLQIPAVAPKFDAFKGHKWHSAQWDHSVNLTGKRVGIVGTGASAAQIIPVIVDQASTLQIYQRSANYLTPLGDNLYSDTWRWLMCTFPILHRLVSLLTFLQLESNCLMQYKLNWFSAIPRLMGYVICWCYRMWQIRDSTLRKAMTPDYEFAARRIIGSDKFFEAIQKPNARVHTSDVAEVEANAIVLEDGTRQELDVLILATGFDWMKHFPPNFLIGKDGSDILTSWNGDPRTYYGTVMPQAPNFFYLWGPNSGIAHNSLTTIIETHVMFAIQGISYMMENDLATLEVTEDAVQEFLTMLHRRMQGMIFTTNVKPKFVNHLGKVPGFWCGTCTEFWWRLRRFHPDSFHKESRTSVHARLKKLNEVENSPSKAINGRDRETLIDDLQV